MVRSGNTSSIASKASLATILRWLDVCRSLLPATCKCSTSSRYRFIAARDSIWPRPTGLGRVGSCGIFTEGIRFCPGKESSSSQVLVEYPLYPRRKRLRAKLSPPASTLSNSVNFAPTMATGSARSSTPPNMHTMAIICPSAVLGTWSPKPTHPKVTTAHHIVEGMERNARLEPRSSQQYPIPSTMLGPHMHSSSYLRRSCGDREALSTHPVRSAK
mmetsp:Transcript_80592/g.184611  ORF Transcript_80592/g.184611 Transcript_80592/m.184611 type:complete len:216 (-) Transcript_80592:250-897(-)